MMESWFFDQRATTKGFEPKPRDLSFRKTAVGNSIVSSPSQSRSEKENQGAQVSTLSPKHGRKLQDAVSVGGIFLLRFKAS